MRAVIALVAALFATPALAITWAHPDIETQGEADFLLDRHFDYCWTVAEGRAPMPPLHDIGSPPVYEFTADLVDRWGRTRATLRGEFSQQETFGSGFADGLAFGASIAARQKARQQRSEIIDDCLISLGWLPFAD